MKKKCAIVHLSPSNQSVIYLLVISKISASKLILIGRKEEGGVWFSSVHSQTKIDIGKDFDFNSAYPVIGELNSKLLFKSVYRLVVKTFTTDHQKGEEG